MSEVEEWLASFGVFFSASPITDETSKALELPCLVLDVSPFSDSSGAVMDVDSVECLCDMSQNGKGGRSFEERLEEMELSVHCRTSVGYKTVCVDT